MVVLVDSLGKRALRSRHFRNRRPVDIGIRQSHLISETCQCYCKIDRYGGFAHAAFSGCHTDDVADIVHLIQSEIESGLLFRSAFLLHYSLDFHVFDFRGMTIDGRPRTAHDVLRQWVTMLCERKGNCHLVP